MGVCVSKSPPCIVWWKGYLNDAGEAVPEPMADTAAGDDDLEDWGLESLIDDDLPATGGEPFRGLANPERLPDFFSGSDRSSQAPST